MKWPVLLLAWSLCAQPLPPIPERMTAALEQQRASVNVQREAAHRQAQAALAQIRNMTPRQPPDPDCEPLAVAVVNPMIESAAQAQAIEAGLLRAVIGQESRFYPCAVSPAGASGLMQLMPATIEQFQVRDAFDPQENIDTGARYLKQLIDRYKGDLRLALGAYNAGPALVDQEQKLPAIPETRQYVEAILKEFSKAQR